MELLRLMLPGLDDANPNIHLIQPAMQGLCGKNGCVAANQHKAGSMVALRRYFTAVTRNTAE